MCSKNVSQKLDAILIIDFASLLQKEYSLSFFESKEYCDLFIDDIIKSYFKIFVQRCPNFSLTVSAYYSILPFNGKKMHLNIPEFTPLFLKDSSDAKTKILMNADLFIVLNKFILKSFEKHESIKTLIFVGYDDLIYEPLFKIAKEAKMFILHGCKKFANLDPENIYFKIRPFMHGVIQSKILKLRDTKEFLNKRNTKVLKETINAHVFNNEETKESIITVEYDNSTKNYPLINIRNYTVHMKILDPSWTEELLREILYNVIKVDPDIVHIKNHTSKKDNVRIAFERKEDAEKCLPLLSIFFRNDGTPWLKENDYFDHEEGNRIKKKSKEKPLSEKMEIC